MVHCVEHTQCPRCAKNGNDRSQDNLCVYSDGSMYCFSCHYFVSAKGIARLKEEVEVLARQLSLPGDADTVLPQRARDFLEKYGLTKLDCQLHTIMWSEFWQRLLFPYFDGTGLVGWQGRYLGQDTDHGRGKAKWYSQGNLKDLLHVVGNKNSGVMVLVEDIISAIKVAHNPSVCAIPLFGSHVDLKKLFALKKICGTIEVRLWLDFDKQKESAKYCNKLCSLGFNARTIITELDPKCYTDEEINEKLSIQG